MAKQASPLKEKRTVKRISFSESLSPGSYDLSLKEAKRLHKRANTREARKTREAERVYAHQSDDADQVNVRGDGVTKAFRMSSQISRERGEMIDCALDFPIIQDAVSGAYVRSNESCGYIISADGNATVQSPAALLSGPEMISVHKKRKPVIGTLFLDYESLGLNPTGIQSATIYQLPNDLKGAVPVSEEVSVVRVSTISEVHHEMFSRCFDIVQARVAAKMGGGTIHIWAHNLAGFDGICTSKNLNITKGGEGAYFAFRHNGVDYFITAEIDQYGGYPKISFEVNLGKDGKFRFEMVDSMAIMATSLKSFATYDYKKTDTPFMFTNTVEWLHEHGYADITAADLQMYIDNSHKYELLPNGFWITNYFVNDEGVEVYTSSPLVTKKHPRGYVFPDRVINAIAYWKSYEDADAIRYGKHDVLMLANALNACYETCESFGVRNVSAYQTIAQIGAQGQIQGITADLYVKDENGKIIFEPLKEGFLIPYPKRKYKSGNDFILAVGNGRGQWTLNKKESEEFMRTGRLPKSQNGSEGSGSEIPDNLPRVLEIDGNVWRVGVNRENPETNEIEFECEVTIRFDGLMEERGYTVQMQSWYISELANRYCFYVQFGGRNDVLCTKNPTGTVVVVIDNNSMYPSVMRDGVRLRFPEMDYLGKEAYYNAILGYVDPRVMQTGATDWMSKSGLAVKVREKKKYSYYGKFVAAKVPELFLPNAELRDQVANAISEIMADKAAKKLKYADFSPLAKFDNITVVDGGRTVVVVRETEIEAVVGRQNALMVLQARGGVFYAKLPRTTCKVLRKVGALPVKLTGNDIEGRVCYPDWRDGRLWGYFTAEELQYFLSQPTVADHLVEIDLSRSCHAPILGVGASYTKEGKPYTFGTPMSCFYSYIDMAWKARHECKKEMKSLAARLKNLENLKTKDPIEKDRIEAKMLELQLRSLMIKTFMNAGGYGVQAQNVKPTVEFNSDDLGSCLEAVTALSTQDDTWGMVDRFTRQAIESLDRYGALDVKRKALEEAISKLGPIGKRLPIEGVSLTDREIFSKYISILKVHFGEEVVEGAERDSDLGRVLSEFREITGHYAWNDLRYYLSLLNQLLAPDIDALHSMEDVILSNRLKADEDAEQTLDRLSRDRAFRDVGELLLARTDLFGEGHPRIESLSGLWEVIKNRLSNARQKLAAELSIYRHIFSEFAANHYRSFHAINLRMDDGRRAVRYMMSTIEVTSPNTNRAFAIAIAAKGRVKLHLGLRAAYDLGFEVAYFDTDSLHLIIPCAAHESPEEILMKTVAAQADLVERFASCRYEYISEAGSEVKEVIIKTGEAKLDADLVIKNLRSIGAQASRNDEGSVMASIRCQGNPIGVMAKLLACKPVIDMGDDLGQWDIEPKFVDKAYAVPGKWEAGQLIRASNVYYLGKKVIMFCDDENNLLDCRVAGISLNQKIERGALMSIVQQAGSIGDREGVTAPKPILVDRLESLDMGTESSPERVCGMFANATRDYSYPRDEYGIADTSIMCSRAILLSPKMAMKSKYFVSSDDGDMVYDPAFKNTVMSSRDLGIAYSQQGYARNHMLGLETMKEAHALFEQQVKIAGKSVPEQRALIKKRYEKLEAEHAKGRIVYQLDSDMYGDLSAEDALAAYEYEKKRDEVLSQLA